MILRLINKQATGKTVIPAIVSFLFHQRSNFPDEFDAD